MCWKYSLINTKIQMKYSKKFCNGIYKLALMKYFSSSRALQLTKIKTSPEDAYNEAFSICNDAIQYISDVQNKEIEKQNKEIERLLLRSLKLEALASERIRN